MGWEITLRAFLALGFVTALIFGVAYLAKKYGARLGLPGFIEGATKKTMALEESFILDGKRRVVVLRRNRVRYMLLLGETDVLLEKWKEGE
jgi:hypothetical protein